jgi:hypothetical protein
LTTLLLLKIKSDVSLHEEDSIAHDPHPVLDAAEPEVGSQLGAVEAWRRSFGWRLHAFSLSMSGNQNGGRSSGDLATLCYCKKQTGQ